VGAGACDKAYLYVSSLKKHIQIAHPSEYDESVKTGKGKYFKIEYCPSFPNPEMDSFESSVFLRGFLEGSRFPLRAFSSLDLLRRIKMSLSGHFFIKYYSGSSRVQRVPQDR
jgi:hypothetical protein